MEDLQELLTIAEFAASRAAAALRSHRESWSGVVAEEGREVKIDADKRAEAIILAILQQMTDYPIISEEAGWVGGAEAARVWAVDPLDGSINYSLGYPQCAVSIALVDHRRPVLGVVDCFAVGEQFSGIVGRGSTRNAAPIHVSSVTEPARGILCTGIPARARTDGAAMDQLVAAMRSWRKVRMIGSAAVALSYVACGRADAYRESGSMIWDIAGGCAVAEAAGALVRIDGGDLSGPLDVVAANSGAAATL